jgi:putative ATPase
MSAQRPLPDLLRPQTLDEFIGQAHLVGAGKPINLAIQNRDIPSMILWGPPGVGKTTLARIMANYTDKEFHLLSAVSAGKPQLREIIETPAKKQTMQNALFQFDEEQTESTGILLFLDEIHRFNKAQQDYLLPFVEDGTVTLIGATTENPSFEVISALLSRVQVFVLHALSEDELKQVIERGVQVAAAQIEEDALDFLVNYANGDARSALNLLDNALRLHGQTLSLHQLKETLQSKHLRYDKTGEEHYNTISAFIKSMRASDVDAALYYLARMVDAGEDPKFIARRMVIFASEDIGMAQPTALVVANAVFRAVEVIGYPECQINLAHGVAYLASAKKDRSACDAYFSALEDVQKYGNLPIPMKLRNAPTQLMKELGYGKGDDTDSLLPTDLDNKQYYPKTETSS